MQTETQKRKVNDRLYPTHRQAEALGILLRSHQQIYNAALEERISAWKRARQSISYAHQCASLTEIRRDLPEWAEANCSSQQMTLRRLDKAFSAFFRRVKSGGTPGFPRFKSLSRFPGFSFKSHGDGWRFTPGKNWKHGSPCVFLAWGMSLAGARRGKAEKYALPICYTGTDSGFCP